MRYYGAESGVRLPLKDSSCGKTKGGVSWWAPRTESEGRVDSLTLPVALAVKRRPPTGRTPGSGGSSGAETLQAPRPLGLPCHGGRPSGSSAVELSPCSQQGEHALRFQQAKVPLPREVSVGFERGLPSGPESTAASPPPNHMKG